MFIQSTHRNQRLRGFLLLLLVFAIPPVFAAEDEQGAFGEVADESAELAKAAQNPIASLISLPIQLNTNFDYGPDNKTQNTLNIQPVYPFQLSEDWNFITRTIVPVVSNPSLVAGGSRETGLGDMTFPGFFSPADSGSWIWGAGPVVLLPTSTDDQLGADEWGAGASVVVLTMPGKWVVGALVQNMWSFAGPDDAPDVNKLTFQYFVNYNLSKGWYLTSTPIMTADWEKPSDQRWTVPLGGGVGKLTRFGKQPVDFKLQAFSIVEQPDGGPEWSLQFAVKFLFPK
jgi:hypothetical protein